MCFQGIASFGPDTELSKSVGSKREELRPMRQRHLNSKTGASPLMDADLVCSYLNKTLTALQIPEAALHFVGD